FLFLHLFEPHTPYEPVEPFRSKYANPYDGEIATVDAILGRFLAELDKRGLYDRSLIILDSDHGEGLGDHGEAEHGVLLYREVLHVPLIVKLPGRQLAGRRVAGKFRSEEHTSELQSRGHLVCRLLLEKKKIISHNYMAGFMSL